SARAPNRDIGPARSFVVGFFDDPVWPSIVTAWGFVVTKTIAPSAFSVMLLVLAACADTSSTPPRAGTANCTVGATAPCACNDGRLGAQTCLANHILGECICAGGPVGDSAGMQPGQDGSGMQPGLDSGAAVRDSPPRDAAVDVANAGDASTPSTVVPDP